MSFKSIINNLRSAARDMERISENFAALNTNEERVRFIYNLFRVDFYNLSFTRIGKCKEKSRELREKGNDHFRKNDLWKAIESYTESIARAPVDSEELYLALGNRGATLLRLKLPKEALMDIERVLSMNISHNYKVKLMARKEKCHQCITNEQLIIVGCEEVQLRTKNEVFNSASSIVKMKDDDCFGRSLFVCDEVKTGEVLIVEKPFSSVIIPNHFYTHCSRCFKRSFNLIACADCATTMYCCEECMMEGRKSHKILCRILESLTALQATSLELLSVKVLTDASKQGEKLNELFMEIAEHDKNNNRQLSYSSEDHMNIYKLVGNTEKRSNSDLFHKSITACVILIILEKFTNFFNQYSHVTKEYQMVFAGSLILHYLQNMPCNAHEISEYCDNDYEEVGAGVYSTLSLINHSCDPNVVRHCYKDVIALRAIRPIKKGDQLFDNYGYHYAVQNIFERQISIAKQYYFECKCEACINKWPLQQDLPEIQPVFKNGINKEKYDLLTKVFKKNVEDIFKGNFEKDILIELNEYLDFLDKYVERPWKPYNICQEAIKHCLGLEGNCFRLTKGILNV